MYEDLIEDYEDENYEQNFQKISRATKGPKQKTYKKQRKRDFRKEIEFKQKNQELELEE